jgi:regulator of sigma E protease
MTTNVFALIIVLGVLIFFHELGHFLVARLCGVGVEKFSLGFGPRIFGKKIGLTDYRVSAIPLGGYVKMVGEEPGAELAPEDVELSFTHKHVLKRIAIVAAGPVFNFLLAVIIFWGLFQFYGVYEVKPIVGVVQEESPAFRAGLLPGDTILEIGDEKVEEWGDLARIITASSGSPLEMIVGRDGSTLQIEVTPELKPGQNEFGEEIDRYVVGIQASGDVVTQKLNPASAMFQSFKHTGMVIKLTFLSVVKIIGGSISADNIG